MVVLSPCDANETREAVKAMIEYDGPCFMRTSRAAPETVTDTIPGYSFKIGKGALLLDGSDVTVIATGIMVQMSLNAAALLEREGIKARIIDMHTIKPVDREIILKAAHETGAIVTAEEHNIVGGLGSAVSEVVSEEYPVPVIRLGVNDEFGHSGEAETLLKVYGLTPENIVNKVHIALNKKNAK
jgi:transketolase